MTMERLERAHIHATRGHTVTVAKARQGYPTDDMSRVVVIARRVVVTIDRDGPVPGIPVTTVSLVVDPEDARDLGLAIAQAADELLAEQTKDEEP